MKKLITCCLAMFLSVIITFTAGNTVFAAELKEDTGIDSDEVIFMEVDNTITDADRVVLKAGPYHKTVNNKSWNTIIQKSGGFDCNVTMTISTTQYANYDLNLAFYDKNGNLLKISEKVLNTKSHKTATFWVAGTVTKITGMLTTQDPTMGIIYGNGTVSADVATTY